VQEMQMHGGKIILEERGKDSFLGVLFPLSYEKLTGNKEDWP